MRTIKITILLIITYLVLFTPKNLFASEGIAEIVSTTNEKSRCFAASLLMQDFNYSIIISCRDLIYPAESDVFYYVIWAEPLENNRPARLGTLDFGKKHLKFNKAFSNLFITAEQNARVKSPTGKIVMRGNIQPISFLETSQPQATPTPAETDQEEPETDQEEPETDQEDTEPKFQELSTKDKIFLALRRAGIAALLAFVALLGLIFIITRSRS